MGNIKLNNDPPDVSAKVSHVYVGLLFQVTGYYISGRYAALCNFLPVCGLLWHHALETLLKSEVVRANPGMADDALDKLLKHTYGHRLSKLWEFVKARYPNADLASHDKTVTRLHAFEAIRYPQGAVTTILHLFYAEKESDKGPVYGPPASGSTLEAFISIEEIDRLFAKLWTVFGLNPRLLNAHTGDGAKLVDPIYELENLFRVQGWRPGVNSEP